MWSQLQHQAGVDFVLETVSIFDFFTLKPLFFLTHELSIGDLRVVDLLWQRLSACLRFYLECRNYWELYLGSLGVFEMYRAE